MVYLFPIIFGNLNKGINLHDMRKERAIKEMKSGRFFSCEFIKRTTGERRKLVGRTGVKKYIKGNSGKGLPYKPFEKDLMPVYDIQIGAYRMINLSSLKKLNGKRVTK